MDAERHIVHSLHNHDEAVDEVVGEAYEPELHELHDNDMHEPIEIRHIEHEHEGDELEQHQYIQQEIFEPQVEHE